MKNEQAIIDMKNVGIRYDQGPEILSDINVSLKRGSFHFLTGKSGAGKTSLLSMMYLAQKPSRGVLNVFDKNVNFTNRDSLALLRRRIGVVFQDFRLLKDRTVFENIAFAQRIIGRSKREMIRNVTTMLTIVGLTDKADAYPNELSGGEQQRVAIARALLNNPKIIIADEPTGNLDPETASNIVGLLKDITKQGTAVVMTTHNIPMLDKFPGIVYRCKDGLLHDVTNEYNHIDLTEDGEEN